MPTPDHTAHLTALLAEIEYATGLPGLALPALPACALCQGEADHIGVWAPEPPLVAEYLAARARRGLAVPADGTCPTAVYCFCHSCLRKPYALKRVQAKLLDRAYLRLDETPLWEERVGRSAALTRTPQGFPDARPRQ